MATQNGRNIPGLVKDTIDEAQKRLHFLEKEAQKLAKDFVTRSRAAQKDFGREFGRLQKRVTSGELFDEARLNKLRGRAREVSGEIVGRLEELQSAILSLVGVASRDQVESVSHELRRLAKKVDGMTRTARKGKSGSISVS
jgi:type I site-specific restriction endonuclease